MINKIMEDLEGQGFVKKESLCNGREVMTRKSTGKEICIQCMDFPFSENETNDMVRIWTKFGIHPFFAYINSGRIRYWDILSMEELKRI